MIYNQEAYDIKTEWGLRGLEQLLPVSDVIIIVDVLSFSTCVDIAVSRGAAVFPYPWKDESAAAYAQSKGAILADFKRKYTGGYSLSPTSLTTLPMEAKIVLPSPNCSTLSLATGETPTLCGCLRNAAAVAAYAMKLGQRISVIAAGEQWADGSLRPALEDQLSAGAVIASLKGSLSPESRAALHLFNSSKPQLAGTIRACISGRELAERGFEADIALACGLNVSEQAPLLTAQAFRTTRDV